MGKIILSLVGVIYGAWLLSAILKKHKRIDTESIAIVNSVQDLGRDELGKLYAIRYDVKSSEPFELLVTPCKKVLKVGTTKSVFYEKAAPNNNYYFKTIGSFDRRLVMPSLVTLASLGLLVTAVSEFINI